MYNPFKKSYSDKELELFGYLANISLFERLTYDEMAHFLPYLILRTYNLDEVVFFRNDPSQALYLIKSGTISLNIDISDRFEPLATMGKGEAFGDNSLLENTRRNYTAIITSEKAELYVIPQVNLLDIFASHPNIKAEMLHAYAEEYNRYTRNLFDAYRTSFGFFDLGQAYLRKG